MRTPHRCLVVVRAGDQSLHRQWTSDLATRRWDLVVSYYGNDSDRYRGVDERRIDDKGQKYHGLHALFTRDPFWRQYDYIWFPDDDLATEQGAIDNLFDSMASLDLALAQPSLSWDSFYSFFVTLQSPGFRMRTSNFIEIMAPCFHRPFLETCLPTFTENLSGWGLDWVWPRLIPADRERCAIIDTAVVTHTRPVGGPTYEKLREAGVAPMEEAHALMQRFNIPLDIDVMFFGAIDREGRPLDAMQTNDAARMRLLLARDRAAIESYRIAHHLAPGNTASRPRLAQPAPAFKWRQ